MREKMKKMLFLMLFLLILGAANVSAQVRIGGNGTPHGAAVLDLNVNNDATPTENKGALALPRVNLSSNTAQLNGTNPITGMLVYNTGGTLGAGIYYWDGSKWQTVGPAYSGSTSVPLSGSSFERAALTGDVIADANSNATTIADGKVTTAKLTDNAVTSAKIADGTVATVDLADGAVTAGKLNQMGASSGQTLRWNGTAWVTTTPLNATVWNFYYSKLDTLRAGVPIIIPKDSVMYPSGCNAGNSWIIATGWMGAPHSGVMYGTDLNGEIYFRRNTGTPSPSGGAGQFRILCLK
ncbi:hypothetical protein FACS189451_02590 [Bacteroidia bacterium]|nr:hypothetical protein FACS189451_02590 [Bacteroidia bacterium]